MTMKKKLISRALITGGLAASVIAGSSGMVASAKLNMGTVPLVLGVEDGSPGFTENFNPYSPNALNGVQWMFEPLYIIDPLNGVQTPWLATSYKWTNPKTLQFTIRSGVKWSDGTAFTAKDVAYTFNLLHKNPALDLNSVWSTLKSVSSSGNTVTFNFKTADIPMFFFVAQTAIVQQKQWSAVKDPVKFTDNNPVVTGPFTVKAFASTEYRMVRNANYWQASKVLVPEVDSVALQSNTTSDLQMSQGKFDLSVLFTPNIQQTYVNRDPAHYHYWFPLSSPVNLVLNLTKAPFNNVKFRQAIAYGMDRERLYKQGEYGYEPPANQALMPPSQQQQWVDPALAKQYDYTYNPQKAAAILASLGYKKNAQGLLVGKDGKTLTFGLQVPTGWTDWIQMTQIIKQTLGQLGITVNVNTPSVTTWYNNQQTGNFDMSIMYGASYASPWFVYHQTLSSDQSAAIGKLASSNFERWMNKPTDNLINQFAKTANPKQQLTIMHKLEKIMFSQVPIVSLVYGASWNEYQTNHYTGWPTATNPYAMPANTYPGYLMMVTHLKPVN